MIYSHKTMLKHRHRHIRRTPIKALLLLVVLAGSCILFADDAGASVSFDYNMSWVVMPDSVMVGDAITFSVAFRVPKDARVVQPETGRGFGNFVILSHESETVAAADHDTAFFRYNLAIFKPQNCTIPSLTFLIGVSDTRFDTLATDAVPVNIISVIPHDISDDELAIKDLKAQQRTGGVSLRSLWALLTVALAILIYYLLGKYIKKKAKGEPMIPLKPPYEEAIEAIAELEARKLLESGSVREYVFELSGIFKRYIGRQYNTIATELTTEEIVAWLEFADISREMRMCAEWFFRTSDQVKFAKWKPDWDTTDKLMKEVRLFLEATKPNPELQYELKTERIGAVE